MLSTLRLPTIGRHWEGFASRADLEGWGDSVVYSYSYSPATGPVMRFGYVSLAPFICIYLADTDISR